MRGQLTGTHWTSGPQIPHCGRKRGLRTRSLLGKTNQPLVGTPREMGDEKELEEGEQAGVGSRQQSLGGCH